MWSSLLTGHTSATCFYMSPGIDTGDIICGYWLPQIFFNVDIRTTDSQSIYRALYAFFDPWVRACVLREICLDDGVDFARLKAVPQSENDGVTYHFMHPKLRQAAFQKLFSTKSS